MKLPEPFLLFDTQQKTVHFLIPTRIDVPMTVAIEPMKLYTEAQLKQAVGDALETATVEATDAISFNGGTVQMEAHVRASIQKLMEGL